MRTRRTPASVLSVLAVVLAVVLATACGTSGPPAASPDEIVWATGAVTANGPATDVAALWNAQHPDGPRVRVEPLPASADEQRQTMALELNAHLATLDVLDLDVVFVPEFASHGWLRDLDAVGEAVDLAALPAAAATGRWNGTLWAAPYTTDAGVLYYRRDLLPAGPPTTWEGLVETGRTVAAAHGITPMVADGQQYEGLTVQFLEYLWAAGGDLGTGPAACSAPVSPDQARRALDFMAGAYHSGVYARDYDRLGQEDARKAFQSGGALFLRSWPYAYQEMNNDPASPVAGRVGIAPLPVFAGGTRAPTTPGLGGHDLGVSQWSRHPEEATDFVRFVTTSPDVQRMLLQRHSLAPVLRSTYGELAGDPMAAYLARTLPFARPRPATPDWPALTEEIQQQTFAAYTGAKPTAAAVDDLRLDLRLSAGCA